MECIEVFKDKMVWRTIDRFKDMTDRIVMGVKENSIQSIYITLSGDAFGASSLLEPFMLDFLS